MRDLFEKFYADADAAMQERFATVTKANDEYNKVISEAYKKEQQTLDEKCRNLFDVINIRVARMLGEPLPSESIVVEMEKVVEEITKSATQQEVERGND